MSAIRNGTELQAQRDRDRTADFEDKVALVTGGGSGIGAHTALLIGARGGAVVVSDIVPDAGLRTVAAIEAAGGTASFVSQDTAVLADAEHVVQYAKSTYGRLDLAVNNAGIAGEHAPIVDSDPSLWRQIIEVNLIGTYYALRSQLPTMLDQGSGSIVNVASIVAANGQANTSGYVASKHGVIGLTKTAALEIGGRGVRVNAVGPGYVRTPMLEMLDENEWSAITALHPIGRVGAPADVAELICFLLSDRASFITGSYHLVDGGYSAQ